MTISAINKVGAFYEIIHNDGSTIVKKININDSQSLVPANGESTGVVLRDDVGEYYLNAADLLAAGFASVASWTAQYNSDKETIESSNSVEGNTGKVEEVNKLVTEAALGTGTTKVITIAIPDGAVILGVSLNNDVAVTTDGGDDTYDAAFSGGDTTVILAGILGALNTKTDKLFVPILTTGVTEITVTAGNSENFSAGTIQVLVHYRTITSMKDA